MRVTVCFQLKKSKSRSDGKCPLYLRCTMNGQRFETSTGLFVEPLSWVEATLGNDYSPLTLKQYRTVRKRFAEFLQKREKRKDIPVAAFNFKLIKSFDVYLKSTYHVASNTAFCYHKIVKRALNQAVAMNYLLRNVSFSLFCTINSPA